MTKIAAMADDPDEVDDSTRQIQIGPHSTMRADVARRLNIPEWAPEQEVRPALERMAELCEAETLSAVTDIGMPRTEPKALAKPAQPIPAISAILPAPQPKRRGRPPKRPLSEILSDCDRAGPGPRRPEFHGARRG